MPLFFVSAGCSLFAGIMVYLITYNEYQHHFKGKRVFKESFLSAVVAFVFFMLLCLALFFLSSKWHF